MKYFIASVSSTYIGTSMMFEFCHNTATYGTLLFVEATAPKVINTVYLM